MSNLIKLKQLYEGKQIKTTMEDVVKLNATVYDETTGLVKQVADNTQAIADQALAAANTYETKENATAKLTEAKQHATDLNTAMDERVTAVEETLNGTGEGEDHVAGLVEKVAANKAAIDVLNGEATEAGSVANTVATEIAKVVNNAPEDFDTLKEVADWIANDQTGAASLGNRVGAVETAVEGINNKIGEVATGETVMGKVAEAKQAANDAQADVDALAGKVGTVAEGETVMGKVTDNATAISDLKAIVDAMTGDEEGSVGSIAEAIKAQIDALDVPDEAVEKQFVVAVPETDGKVAVQRRALVATDIPTITQGQVEGLTDAIADAKKAGTDAQGTADTALANAATAQGAADKAQGEVDALEKVVGEVAEGKTVVGLIEAAQTQADKGVQDAATAQAAADKAQGDVDTLTETVGDLGLTEGETLADVISDLKGAVGEGGSVETQITSAIEDLDVTDAEVTGEFVVAVPQTDGKVAPVRRALTKTDIPTIDQAQVDGLPKKLEAVDTAVAKNAENIATNAAGIKANKEAIDVLNGEATVDGSVKKQVADAVAAVVANAPENLNTLKEIADWIAKDQTEAAPLVNRVGANETAIANLVKLVGSLPEGAASTTIVDYVSEVVNGAGHASAEDLGKAVERIATLEGKMTTVETKLAGIEEGAQVNVIETVKVNGVALTVTDKAVDVTVPTGALASKDIVTEAEIDSTVMEKINASAQGNHSHSNKTVLDGITEALVTDWNDAVAKEHEHTNKAELDLIASGDKAKWDAAEAKAHVHANATVLDGITAEKVVAWDSAEADAIAEAKKVDEKVVLKSVAASNATAPFSIPMTADSGYAIVEGSLAKVIINSAVYVVEAAASVSVDPGFDLEADDTVYVEFREKLA